MTELIIIAFVAYIIYRLYKSFNRSVDERKNAENSIISLSNEIKKSPDSPRYYFLRGTCYHRLHNYRLAIDDYTKAFELNSDNRSFNFLSGSGNFNNYWILKNRSSSKSDIGDKYGSKQDEELANKYK